MEQTKPTPIRTTIRAILPWVLAAASAVALLVNIPSADNLSDYTTDIIIYSFLTGIALLFAALLTVGELSPAHVIGMLAFLSLPEDALSVALWTMFIGAAAGGAAVIMRARIAKEPHTPYRWSSLVFITVRLIISLYVAAKVYVIVGGKLPLDSTVWEAHPETALTLALFTLVYVGIYLTFFLLECWYEGFTPREIIRDDMGRILVILLLPIPFAVLSAEVAGSLSREAESVSIIALALIILSVHALTMSEYRLRRQLGELRTLADVTRATRGSLELDRLLDTIYTRVAELLGTENFAVALQDLRRGNIDYPYLVRDGKTQAETAAFPGDALVGHVLTTHTPLLLEDDVPNQARALGLSSPGVTVHSWLGVPLTVDGTIEGVMAVWSTDPQLHFGQRDLRLLNVVAASAGAIIENARLYRQQTERVEQLATMNNIAALLSGTLSPDSVLETIISSASTVAQCNAVAVFLVDEDSTKIETSMSAGFSEKLTATLPKPLLLSDDMPLRTRTPLAIANITGNERAALVQDTLLAEGMLSVMELPLIIDDSGLGVLALYFTEAQTFGAEQMELLRSYATQASLAIKNARTYTSTDRALQRSVDQLVALADIGKLLASTINLDSIGELVLNHAADATHANSGAVALFDEVTDDLRVVAHIGYRDGQFIDPELIRQGAAGKVLNTGATLRLDNITRAAGYRSLRPTTSSQLAVPIARGKTMLGCILLEGDVPASFTADDSQFVGQIANQAVVAIDNANLFRRITEARDRLQVILNAMEEAIILIDRRGRVVLANPRITTLGLEPDTIVERPLEGLLRVESLRLPERLGFKNMEDAVAFARSAADPDQWPTAPHLYSVQVSGSTHFIQRNVIPVQDEDGMVIGGLLVFYDKSEEQELAHAREQLSRMLVHDLRSPLTAVTTTLKLLNEIIPADSEYHELVTETTGSSRRALRKLLNRVDSLLDISRMESGRLSIETEITDLDELAEAVIEELGPLARELEVSVTANLNAATPPLDVDGDKVERLLINLVDNALKYAPAESKIEIRSYPAGENGAEAGFVRVDVTDQGPGIPTEYKETLFDSFVQVEGRERVRRGVGLGLSFCKLTAEAHGGRIWIEDNPGGGSVFAFTLPAATLTRLPEDEDETSVSLG